MCTYGVYSKNEHNVFIAKTYIYNVFIAKVYVWCL